MAEEAEASTVEAVLTRAVEAGAHIHHPLPGMQVHAPQGLLVRARGAGTRRGPATITLDRGGLSRAGISGMEIQTRRHPPSRTASGIPSAAQAEAADLRADNRRPGHQATREVSTSLPGIARRDPQGRYAAFQGRAVKFGRMLPHREMLFPGLSRLPRFTIRSAVRPLRLQGSDRIRRSLHLRALPADRRWLAIGDFRVA
jgi:hypothetical protein